MAYPKIIARVTETRAEEVYLPQPPESDKVQAAVKRVAMVRFSPPGISIEVPAEYLPQDVMVGDEFEIDFFHVRRPREAQNACRE